MPGTTTILSFFPNRTESHEGNLLDLKFLGAIFASVPFVEKQINKIIIKPIGDQVIVGKQRQKRKLLMTNFLFIELAHQKTWVLNSYPTSLLIKDHLINFFKDEELSGE